MWDAVKHFAESSDKIDEHDCAFEYRFRRHTRPLRILSECFQVNKTLSTQFRYGFVQLWKKNVDKEVIKK